MKRTLAAVLTLSVCSCSLVFSRGPGNVGKPPQKLADCTTGKALPITDAIIGGVILLSSLGVLNSYNADTGESEGPSTAVSITGALIAGVFGVSSYIGFSRSSKCRASRAEYLEGHPPPMLNPLANIPVGADGGLCTPGLTCDAGLVCSGMPDRTNRCIVASQVATTPTGPVQPTGPQIPVGMQGGACTPQLTCVLGLVCAGMPDHTNKCMPAQGSYLPPQKDVPPPPPPPAPAMGAQGGACTAQLTCNQGLVCAGMPDRTNKCMVGQIGPAVGAQGGACTQQLTCNQGLVCSGMPDRTNKCIAAPPPAAPAVGAQGGACTQQLTCNQGLVCSGMPDRTNKCIPAPVGAQGGACTQQLTCNQGLVCSGMPDRTNKCIYMPK